MDPSCSGSEMVKWSKGPTAVVGPVDLSLTKECEGQVMVVGNGGFGGF